MARVERNPNFAREYFAVNGPRWQNEAGNATKAAIAAEAPVDSGEIVAGIGFKPTFDPDGAPAIRFEFDADHTLFVDQGTGVYGKYGARIKPRTAKVLAWMQDGQQKFARSVKGQKGQHFIAGGLKKVFKRVIEYRHGA